MPLEDSRPSSRVRFSRRLKWAVCCCHCWGLKVTRVGDWSSSLHFKQFASQPVEVAVQVHFLPGVRTIPTTGFAGGCRCRSGCRVPLRANGRSCGTVPAYRRCSVRRGVVNNDGVAVYLVRRGRLLRDGPPYRGCLRICRNLVPARRPGC